MDTCAILERDACVTIAQMIAVKAELAAHGIDAIILPVGMTLAGMRGSADREDDDE